MDDIAHSIAEASARYLLKNAAFASNWCGLPPDQLVPIFKTLARKYDEPKWFDEDQLEDEGIPWLNPSKMIQAVEGLDRGVNVWVQVPAFAFLVAQLVKWHGPSVAQHIVEAEDLDLLKERNHRLCSLLSSGRFLTTDELATRAEAFIQYLEQNRSSLLSTGYPTTVFTSWPHPLAVNLYPVKLDWNLFEGAFTPKRMVQEGDPFVIERPPFLWCCPIPEGEDTTVQDSDDLPAPPWCPDGTVPCRYDDAPLDIDADLAEVRRLEDGRPALLDLKIRLRRRLTHALRQGRAAGLWDDCLRLLTDALLGKDADFYLIEDSRRGPILRQTGQLATFSTPELLPGGLTEMLELIGYCEKELTLGTMDRTKRALVSVVEPNESDPYLAALRTPTRSVIDTALDDLDKRNAREPAFWQEFQTRVNQALENEFEEEVIVRTRVKRPHAAKFEPGLLFLAEWTRLHLEQTGDLPSLQAVRLTPLPANRFRREGNLWTIIFEGQEVHLKDSKGLHFLTYLLRYPSQEFHVLDLVRAVDGTVASTNHTDRQRSDIEDDIGATSVGFGDAGPIADEQTKKALKQRLQEIDEEIEDADALGDSEGADALRQERDDIRQYLSGAYGLGGRKRVASSPAERARTRVTRAIRRALDEIADVHPSLAGHLQSITTGTYCSYDPPGDEAPAWEF